MPSLLEHCRVATEEDAVNWLMPSIFGLGKITFFQAFGLKLLLGLIFGRISFNETRKQ